MKNTYTYTEIPTIRKHLQDIVSPAQLRYFLNHSKRMLVMFDEVYNLFKARTEELIVLRGVSFNLWFLDILDEIEILHENKDHYKKMYKLNTNQGIKYPNFDVLLMPELKIELNVFEWGEECLWPKMRAHITERELKRFDWNKNLASLTLGCSTRGLREYMNRDKFMYRDYSEIFSLEYSIDVDIVDRVKKELIRKALVQADGKRYLAAEYAGINVKSLRDYIRKYKVNDNQVAGYLKDDSIQKNIF
jgi:hypothetical protein